MKALSQVAMSVSIFIFFTALIIQQWSAVSAKPTSIRRVIDSDYKTKSRRTFVGPSSKGPITGDALVNLLAITYDFINANTTLNAVDEPAAAFNFMGNSYGFNALNNFMNTVANIFTVYDALGGAVERYIVRSRQRKERKTNSTEAAYQAAIQSNFKRVAQQMEVMNKQLKCRLLFPALSSTNSLMDCLNSSLIKNKDDGEEDGGEDDNDESDYDELTSLNEVEENHEFIYNKDFYNFFQKIV